MSNVSEAVAELDALTGADPEISHSMADDVLLANVDPEIVAAYKRLVQRCSWWACA